MKNIIDNKNNIIVESKPEVLYEFEDGVKKYIPLLQKAMEDTVSKPYGTAYLLHDLPIKVAGKTGSAQVEGNTKINAFFVGYAPAQNPQIALLLLIENAKEGSLNVVPVAKEVFLWYYENRLTKNH
jgi:penicillin-binding protein 2